MASPDRAALDQLYQLPLAEFTAARNTLAKGAGAAASDIRALAKPPLPAWAVNQLYWKRRQVYDALVQRAEDLRATHKAILIGRPGNLRTAGKAHDESVDAALKATLALLDAAGERATHATRQAIASTLRALPSQDLPGRLARVLQPGGFEMLAGITPVPAVVREFRSEPARRATPPPKARRGTAATPTRQSKADQRALARAREAAANAVGAARQAEQAARQHEFEAARAGREAEKAARRLAAAREAVEAAQLEAAEAERQSAAAARKRDTIHQRALEAQQKARAAHQRTSAAESEIAALSRRSDE